ncbi:Hypothetical predicted protein [Mytilus galloprovincialis]|uniref:Uncharacterized protein n=1 Tax=Mytilus galloprovincialis TaxID=29158 RepID=A0A8B6H0U0_MYTGA|nr:Hypothetical predicted protein [Mytilus galloprovincialis]
MTHELDEKTLVEAETMTHELDEKRFVDAETMTLELDKKTLVEAETMTLGLGVNKTSVEAETMTHELDEKKCVDAETMTHEQDTFPVIQAQTAIQGPKTFNIELHFPGIIVFEIMKMEKEMVLTGINLHMKNHYKLFVINIETHKHESFDLENKPNNMTSIDDNIVALPYPDIQKVDMLNLKTGRIEHTIKVNCLAIFHSNDHLYVIKYGKVERINIAGVSIESFNLPTKMIKHISVYDKRLFYTCYESLYCCDLNGTQLWRFIPKIEKRLSDVATDKYGNIYVSSADPVNVLVISQEGKYLKHISMNFENETRPVKIHCDELHNRLSILRPSNNVIAFFDV